MTLHRLLGWRPDNTTRFRHDRGNRLKYDVVVVDECSMVDLTMMARLLEARAAADPAGAGRRPAPAHLRRCRVRCCPTWVEGLPDVAGRAGCRPTTAPPRHPAAGRGVARRRGRRRRARRAADAVATRSSSSRPTTRRRSCVRPCVQQRGGGRARLAVAGDAEAAIAALDRHRLLCAHREGPCGVRLLEPAGRAWLGEETGEPIYGAWYVGRPLLVTANDYALEIYNGETGVAVLADGAGSAPAIDGARHGLTDLAPGRLDARRHHARDDDPQEPGQPGRARSPCCCPRRARGC